MAKFIADFHLHSKYSRATSKEMDLENLDKWAKIKGITVLGTGDFTHPEWLRNLKEKLEPAEPGLYKLKVSSGKNETRFVLTAEISCIYSKGGKVRKIHVVVFAPSLEIVEKINTRLGLIGNLRADGRPILGLDAKELLKIILDVSEDCLVMPAHCLTPWFAIFGSKSGFDSLKECFEDLSDRIFAVETGLSADPKMLWRLSELDNVSLISNSDAHSPQNLGREANVFDVEKNYFAIIEAIKEKNPKKFLYTIEFYPEEGKYHYDGHRNCDISLHPRESIKYNDICPVCGKPLTIGVLNRVEKLADREEGFKPARAIPFKSLVPLAEIISQVLNLGKDTKGVKREYDNVTRLGSEFEILLDIPIEDIKNKGFSDIASAIQKVREGNIQIKPGFDGVFGEVKIFSSLERKNKDQQKVLL